MTLVLFSSFCFPNTAGAQAVAGQSPDDPPADRVWIAPSSDTDSGPSSGTDVPWYPEPVVVRRGRITLLDDQQLRLAPVGGETEVTIAAERVLWIEPGEQSEQELAAIGKFRDRRYAESLRPLIDSLESQPPVWRQQWLLMAAAQAAWRGARPAVALELVSQLDERPLPPLVLAWLPVAWGTARPSPADQAAASQKLSDASPAVRLVAASWLLSSTERQQAKRVLGELAAGDARPRIARLAEAALWRAALPAEAIESASQWEQKVDALPLVLQVGPAIALVEKLQAAGAAGDAGGLAKRWRWSLELTPPHPHPDLPLTTGAAN